MEIGYLLIILSFLLSLVSSFFFIWAVRSPGKRAVKYAINGERALYLYAAIVFFAYLLLTYYFLNRDFDVKYVYSYSDTHLSFLYTVSAVWAGREGSLLLWTMFVSALNIILIKTERKDRITALSLGISGMVVSFFLFVMLTVSNPFERWGLGQPIPEGYGLNPLLRTPEMALHPPTVFLGYASATFPFAIAIASVYLNQEGWHLKIRRWAVLSWIFLTLGIFIGGWWAYKTLGWGGFWAWDPVENASLLPWLTVTALLHGIMRDRNFRAWNYWLSAISFILVVLATFITRSGIIESVHAFGKNPEGWFFLSLIIFVLTGSLVIHVRNKKMLAEKDYQTASREFTIFLNLVILILATGTVMVGTVSPAIVDNLNVGREYYDRVETPLAVLLTILLGVCIAIGWTYNRNRVKKLFRISIPAGIVVLAGVFMLTGMGYIALASGIGAFTVINHVLTFNRKDILNPRKFGGYLVHVGIILIAVGISGAWMYDEVYKNVRIDLGNEIKLDTQNFGEVTVRFDDMYQKESHEKLEVFAEVSIFRDGEFEGKTAPSMKLYNLQREDRVIGGIGILSKPCLDYYVAMGGFKENSVFIEFHIVPLVGLVWIGSALMMAGGTVSLLLRSGEKKS